MDGLIPLILGAVIFGAVAALLGRWFSPVVAAGAFIWRWWLEIRRLEPDREIDGRPFYTQLWRRSAPGPARLDGSFARSVVGGFRIGLSYGTTSTFELHAESVPDARLRAHHLERHEQTGDDAFDGDVHVYADRVDVVTFLRDNAGARDAVRAAFAAGFHSVSADGRILWAARSSREPASEQDEQMLSKLLRAFAPFEMSAPRRWTLARLATTFVDGLVFAIVAVGIVTAIQMVLEEWDLHVNAYALIPPTVVILLAVAIAIVGLAVVLLRGTPGVRDILVRRAGIIALSLPFASLQAASGINTQMDSSPPVVVTRTITKKFARGRYSTRQYIVLSPSADSDPMRGPRTQLRVHGWIYDRARPGRVLRLTIGRGRLGIPWYRDVDVLAEPGEMPRRGCRSDPSGSLAAFATSPRGVRAEVGPAFQLLCPFSNGSGGRGRDPERAPID
jgi:hypothetical protein